MISPRLQRALATVPRSAVACGLLAAGVQLAALNAPPAAAHMNASHNHVGGSRERSLVWYDETGHPGWVAAEGRYAQTHYNYWAFWNRDRAVPVPYLDFRTSGGTPGCRNQPLGIDVCMGDPGGAHAALAWYTFAADTRHVISGNVTVRNTYTDRQKEAIICQEINHVLGLDHNAHFPTSASQSCMYPSLTANPAVAYDAHDDETLRSMYAGHQP